MKVLLQSEDQQAFILERDEESFYLYDRRLNMSYGPAEELQYTRHGLWFPFAGDPAAVLKLFVATKPVALDSDLPD